MVKNLLTYALDSSNKLKHVDAVENGMACGCVCPCCKEKLMAMEERKECTILLMRQV